MDIARRPGPRPAGTPGYVAPEVPGARRAALALGRPLRARRHAPPGPHGRAARAARCHRADAPPAVDRAPPHGHRGGSSIRTLFHALVTRSGLPASSSGPRDAIADVGPRPPRSRVGTAPAAACSEPLGDPRPRSPRLDTPLAEVITASLDRGSPRATPRATARRPGRDPRRVDARRARRAGRRAAAGPSHGAARDWAQPDARRRDCRGRGPAVPGARMPTRLRSAGARCRPLLRAFEALPAGARGLPRPRPGRPRLRRLAAGDQRGVPTATRRSRRSRTRWCRRAPTSPSVLAIDDLQWGDGRTLDLLRLIAEQAALSARARLLVVAAVRDEPQASAPLRALLGLAGASVSPGLRHLALGPLAPDDAARLARGLGPVGIEVEQAVVRGAGGQPLLRRPRLARLARDRRRHLSRGRLPGGGGRGARRRAGRGHAARGAARGLVRGGQPRGADRAPRPRRDRALRRRPPRGGAPPGQRRRGERRPRPRGPLRRGGPHRRGRPAGVRLRRGDGASGRAQPRPAEAVVLGLYRALLDTLARGPGARPRDAAFLATGYERLGAFDPARTWLRRAMDGAAAEGLFADAAELGDRLAALAPDPDARAEVALDVVRALVVGRQFEDAGGRLAAPRRDHAAARRGALPPPALAPDLQARRSPAGSTSPASATRRSVADADRAGDGEIACEARMALAGVAPEERALSLAGEAVALSEHLGAPHGARGAGAPGRARLLRRPPRPRARARRPHPCSRSRRPPRLPSWRCTSRPTWRWSRPTSATSTPRSPAAPAPRTGRSRRACRASGACSRRTSRRSPACGLAAEAAETAERTARPAASAGDPVLRALALSLRADALRRTGDLEGALESIGEAERLQREQGDWKRALTLLRRAQILEALARLRSRPAPTRGRRAASPNSTGGAPSWRRRMDALHQARRGLGRPRRPPPRARGRAGSRRRGARATQSLIVEAEAWLAASGQR